MCYYTNTSKNERIKHTKNRNHSMLYRLFYVSRCTKQSSFDETNIATQIISYAILNNKKLGITGAITFDGNDFAQILEGEKSVVLNLFEKIKADPRHDNVSIIKNQDIETRHYEEWAMKHLDSTNYDELVRVMD